VGLEGMQSLRFYQMQFSSKTTHLNIYNYLGYSYLLQLSSKYYCLSDAVYQIDIFITSLLGGVLSFCLIIEND